MHFNQQMQLQFQEDLHSLKSELELRTKELEQSKETIKVLSQKKKESASAIQTTDVS